MCFIVVDQLTQWKSIHHTITTHLHCRHTLTKKKPPPYRSTEWNNNRNNNNTQKKIYFLYFNVPFFSVLSILRSLRVISGSFQFEFLAGNLHEYNDFWASTKRDNILKLRDTQREREAQKEREWIHQWIVRYVCWWLIS